MAAWKRADTCSPPSLSPPLLALALAVFPSLVFSSVPSLPHMDKQPQIHIQVVPLCSHYFSFFTCSASVCVHTFPSSLSSPCVCLCSSSSSCLIFLETNYRALQEEKKKQRGSSFGNVRPASFLLTFMRTSSFPYRTSSFPSRLCLYICLCPLYIPLKSSSLFCSLWTVALNISSLGFTRLIRLSACCNVSVSDVSSCLCA